MSVAIAGRIVEAPIAKFGEGTSGTLRGAEDLSSLFQSVPQDPHSAELARGRKYICSTFEAVKDARRPQVRDGVRIRAEVSTCETSESHVSAPSHRRRRSGRIADVPPAT